MHRRAFLLSCVALPCFARPDLASEEGGLWEFMDREEQRLKRSAFLIRDPALNAYVSGIACGLAGEHCPELRIYLVRTPVFNATMAPNGMMQIGSGLLLRMSNEAQLAAIIGHEIGHYVARHSLERLREAKSRSALGQLISFALSPAAVLGGAVSSLAQLALETGGYAYGREHEREADRIGMELMTRAGYAPSEAAQVWSQLLEEVQEERSLLFATHPAAAERQQNLQQAAKSFGQRGTQAYRAAQTMREAPPELYRSMGLVLRRLGDEREASSAFRRYLELRPGAVDAELVRSYL